MRRGESYPENMEKPWNFKDMLGYNLKTILYYLNNKRWSGSKTKFRFYVIYLCELFIEMLYLFIYLFMWGVCEDGRHGEMIRYVLCWN